MIVASAAMYGHSCSATAEDDGLDRDDHGADDREQVSARLAGHDLVQSNLHKSGIRREVASILGDLVLLFAVTSASSQTSLARTGVWCESN